MSDSRKYTINELAQYAIVNRRTVRYYVQRGLFAPPIGKGRGSHYTETHLRHLLYIRDQQLKGSSLEQIDVGHSLPLPMMESNKQLNPILDQASIHSSGDQFSDGYSSQSMKDSHKEASSKGTSFQESLNRIQYSTSQWTQITLNPNVHLNFKTHYFNPQQTQEIFNLIQNFIDKQSGEYK